MPTPAARPRRKRPGQYHHGDLRRALVAEALRTIRDHGVAELTLRTVGARLGVSRTALYRHFTDKQALLAAVAREGFRMLSDTLGNAWAAAPGPAGFEAMGRAYVEFAVTHPAHYRVMFGSFVESCERDPELTREASAAFTCLVDALVTLQRLQAVRADDPVTIARFVWSTVHGIAMLAIDGQLAPADTQAAALTGYATERLRDALRMSSTAA